MNVLQTVEVSATQPGSKEATINQGQAQLALAVNGVATFNADANPTLLVTDLLRNSKLILTCTAAGHSVTFAPVQRVYIFVSAPSTNTHPLNVVCGATTVALQVGGYYFIEFDGTANGMIVNALVTIGTGPFVLKTGDTMTGALTLAAGAVGTPSLRVGDADTGLYLSATGNLSAAVDGFQAWNTNLAGVDIYRSGNTALMVVSDGLASLTANSYSNNAAGSRNQMQKARGTFAAPAPVVTNDGLGDFIWRCLVDALGATNVIVAQLRAFITEASPTGSAAGGRVTMQINPIGSVTNTEIVRWEHATGVSLFGANPVIDQNRVHRLRSYTIATVPAAAIAAGQAIYVSDQFSGALGYSDGTNWRYNVPCFIGTTEIIRPSTTGVAFGSGFAAAEAIHAKRTGATACRIIIDSDNAALFQATRYSSDNSPSGMAGRKSRGTAAAPTVVVQNDQIFSFSSQAYDGSAFKVSGELLFTVIPATPSATDMETRLATLLAAAGSVTRTEIMRLEHATGLSMFGANVVIDQNRHLTLRQYTNAGKPAASSNTGKAIFVTDYLGGVEVCSDGTDWVVGTDVFVYALSDETTAITTGTAKLTTRAPYKSKIVDLKANLNTVSSSGIPTVDINGNAGTTYLSTKLTIDATELSSRTAAAAYVLSTSTFAEDDAITFDIDVAGTGAKGLKVHMTLKHIL